jgi:hypothetical protein
VDHARPRCATARPRRGRRRPKWGSNRAPSTTDPVGMRASPPGT